MSRNENSLFSRLPSIHINRSRFRRNSGNTFTGNVGTLIPFYVDEVLPGDTHQIKTNKVVRLQTPITPFMGQLYLDTYYFFVPNRLVWSHWKEFMGENTSSPWLPSVTYTIPTLAMDNSHKPQAGSALDYMGIPVGIVQNNAISALPLRSYYKIWNEWFRDENLQYPLNVSDGDTGGTISSTNNNVNDGTTGTPVFGGLCAVAKFHDYFTSALPAPQKGPEVTISSISNAPVKSSGVIKLSTNGTTGPYDLKTMDPNIAQNGLVANPNQGNIPVNNQIQLYNAGSNLYADLQGIGVATINQLRTAFQIQKLFEADSRGGTRYTELLRQHFSVVSPDARLQRPEYLGGNRIPINVHQVVQSSETGTTPQGTTAAYSLTVDGHGDFIRSFTEHGYIIGLMCVRYDHTYQQGVERFWTRKTRLDFYWPVLAHLGEQEIYNREIMAQGDSAVNAVSGKKYDEEIFGFQERWAEYRYKPSRVSAEMRSSYATSLDKWHLADDYSSLPALSAGWICEDKSNVDRVLQVASTVSNQLLFDVYVENTTTRPMPLHSVPGLVDHF